MIPERLAPHLKQIAATLSDLPGYDPALEVEPLLPTGDPRHGDYQWNHALKVAKSLKQNPRALAERLRAQFTPEVRAACGIRQADPAGDDGIAIAGPGFLNLRLDDAWLAATLRAQAADPRQGLPQSGAGKTAIIDFSSPNVAKRMHIGHMRSTHIGHALCRLHRAAGWNVVGDNHIGDWGTQFGMLFHAWKHHHADPQIAAQTDAAFEADPVGELERLYVWFRRHVDAAKEQADEANQEALMEAARAETARLQQGDPENTALWRRFIEVSLAEFNAVYRRMGVTFDEVLGESVYNDRVEGIVTGLIDAGIAESSQGAIIVRFDEPALRSQVMIVRKKDGAANYAATDLGCVRYREERWAPARVIYVTDKRQQLHFQQVFAVARRWGVQTELIHAWFGTLVLPTGMMSTREGNVIRLVDLLDEAARRARAVVDAKSPELPEADRAAIAEAVGVSSIRYADLSQNPQTDVAFDWDRMLSLDGNTAPYLLYSHARSFTLLRKAADQGHWPHADPGRADPGALGALDLPPPGDAPEERAAAELERSLVLALLRLPEAAAVALRTTRPNALCDHLFEVCNRFNRFYHDAPVLKAAPADRSRRLALVEAARRGLRWGMEVLGLHILDRM